MVATKTTKTTKTTKPNGFLGVPASLHAQRIFLSYRGRNHKWTITPRSQARSVLAFTGVFRNLRECQCGTQRCRWSVWTLIPSKIVSHDFFDSKCQFLQRSGRHAFSPIFTLARGKRRDARRWRARRPSTPACSGPPRRTAAPA